MKWNFGICACAVLFGAVILQTVSSRIINREGRALTKEEEELANKARAEIAKVIEKNLIRILTIIALENEHPIPRQDDDGDEDVLAAVTPNPNVLPQVAQILGAVFAGSLNITRVVDGSFGLVPNIVRNQLQGIVKLLTGENVQLGPTTPSPANTQDPDAFEEPSTVVPLIESTTTAAPTTSTVATTTEKGRYKVRQRTKKTTVAPNKKPLVDDEIERFERDLVEAGRLLAPYEHRNPKVYAGIFGNLFENVNVTEVTKAVPSIFKGATQAFSLMENLGLLDTLPGSELVDELEDATETTTTQKTKTKTKTKEKKEDEEKDVEEKDVEEDDED